VDEAASDEAVPRKDRMVGKEEEEDVRQQTADSDTRVMAKHHHLRTYPCCIALHILPPCPGGQRLCELADWQPGPTHIGRLGHWAALLHARNNDAVRWQTATRVIISVKTRLCTTSPTLRLFNANLDTMHYIAISITNNTGKPQQLRPPTELQSWRN